MGPRMKHFGRSDRLPAPGRQFRRLWREADTRIMQEMAARGMSCRDIAARTGWHERTVQLRAQRNGISPARGLAPERAGGKRHPKDMGPEEAAAFRALAEAGATAIALAARFNLTEYGVRKLARRQGVRLRSGGSGKNRNRWTEAHVRHARELVAQGLTVTEISLRLGFTYSLIYMRLQKMGLRAAAHPNAPNIKLAPDEDARRAWGAAENEELRGLAEAGLSVAEASILMQRPPNQVLGRALRLGLRLAETPPPRPVRERECLGCRSKFQSEGAHHRMCDACRRRRHLSRQWEMW